MLRLPGLNSALRRARHSRGAGALLCLLGLLVGCQSLAAPAATPTPAAPVAAAAPAPPPPPSPPPYVEPPRPGPEHWVLPEIGVSQPYFPLLPGDDTQASRSIGDVVNGHLYNAQALPLPHPHMAILEVQRTRGLLYTSEPMVALIEDAAAHLADRHPGSVVYLGNFGRKGGGDIPYSVSHNNGRDADLAIFMLDPQGQPVVAHDLLPLDEQGTFTGEPGSEFEGLEVRFDPTRNWTLVEGLLQSNAAELQYIFISNPLRQMLLAEGRRQGASAATLQRAATLLVQPGGALPHNDHFHLRIHCAPEDLASGCQERGRRGPGFRPDLRARREAIARANTYLNDATPALRARAIERLALLRVSTASAAVIERLSDPSPRVRAAAARALPELGRHSRALSARLEHETHPRVVAELIHALSQVPGDDALHALTSALTRTRTVDLGPSGQLPLSALAAEALARRDDPRPVPFLIEALDQADPLTRRQIAHALRILTNHDLGAVAHALDTRPDADSPAALWRAWYQEHQNLDRDQWLARGFQLAGFPVEELSLSHVWDLCQAVAEAPHISYNAQRTLMRLSGNEPASLSWPRHDANFYWRRWFERRWQRMGLPPMPPELTTLGPNNPYAASDDND
ncbi:hypothetical protein DL240_04530 [Lujinxingia litoralis]|uniref:HEAT repeat domain-containing protein n=1 Tax=Lujinxingia litoralis TaxID=2211119 RepID=A0A328CER5_9DELT|nr:penicillin-insensitive murein endopeptidase [Lujinxingia litoralis]RAL25483.1 hypothetical protein DL240_04530 [Lujinxingia litoralis]